MTLDTGPGINGRLKGLWRRRREDDHASSFETILLKITCQCLCLENGLVTQPKKKKGPERRWKKQVWKEENKWRRLLYSFLLGWCPLNSEQDYKFAGITDCMWSWLLRTYSRRGSRWKVLKEFDNEEAARKCCVPRFFLPFFSFLFVSLYDVICWKSQKCSCYPSTASFLLGKIWSGRKNLQVKERGITS